MKAARQPAAMKPPDAQGGEVQFTVPGAYPPSGNEMRRKYRHWAAYARLRDQWFEWIYAAALAQNLGPDDLAGHERKHTRVSIHVAHDRARMLDQDNLEAGMKPLYDSLRKCGLIVNDSPKWMEQLKPTQERVKNEKLVCTRIIIETVDA